MYKTKKCVTCNKEFTPGYPGQKYDNAKCSEVGRAKSVIKHLNKIVEAENEGK